jgi:cell division transport system permease protein
MFLNLHKIFKFGLQNFARNFWLAVLTISVLFFLLLSINVLAAINFLTDEASRQVKAKVDVSIYLKPTATDAQAQSLRTYLTSLPSVASAVYTPADEALKTFTEKHKNEPEIIASLGVLDKNPFGGYIVVQTVNVDDYKKVLSQLDSQVYKSIIENKDFNDHEKLVDIINSLTDRVKQLIIIVSGFFAFISMVIVFNTIKIAIYTHREEIGIMNLVGASRWFIAGQFIFEAILYSFIAVVITFIVVFSVVPFIQPMIMNFLSGLGGDLFGFYRSQFLTLFSVQFLIVAGLSSVSAFLATSRYLKK